MTQQQAQGLEARELKTQELEFAISIRGLEKTYGEGNQSKQALKGVDLDIKRGAIFGLLGPNGAGKSTLINILANLVNKSAGTVQIWGYDLERENRKCRSALGVVPQEITLDPFFTPRRALELMAGFYGIPAAARRTDEILEAMGLSAKADAYARSLSGGMKRRLMVGKAMVHNPPILILDEPTAGVDVELRRNLWRYVKELNAQGVTIVLTTHYLEEAESLCDQIAIMNHGRVIAHDDKDKLMHRLSSKMLTIKVQSPLSAVPEKLLPFAPTLSNAQSLNFIFDQNKVKMNDILRAVRQAELEIEDISTQEPDLEDVFLALTSE